MTDKIKIKSVDEGLTARKQVPINLMMKNRLGLKKWMIIILLCVLLGGSSGMIASRYLFPYLLTFSWFEKFKVLAPSEKVVVKKVDEVKVKEENVISDLAKKTRPQVVGIIKTSLLEDFLGRAKKIDQGYGVILTSDGIIAATKAAVPDKGTYSIITHDGKNYKTDKIFFDPASDLVFLKIKADDLSSVDLKNLEEIEAGQKIFVFKDLMLRPSFSVNVGFVENPSFVFTSLVEENLDQFVKTGFESLKNSDFGGPVFDLSGKALALVAKSEGGSFYAISFDFVKKPLSDVIKYGKIKRPKLGIKYLNVSPDFANFFDLKKSSGAYLPKNLAKDAVIQKSPAHEAGLQAGDLIYAINGKEISLDKTYFELISQFEVGDEIEISYLRAGKENKTKAKLEER